MKCTLLALVLCSLACGSDRLRGVPREPLEPVEAPSDPFVEERQPDPLGPPDAEPEPGGDPLVISEETPDEAAPPAYQARVYLECVDTTDGRGADLYWIDSDGQPSELAEDCGYFGTSLNCAGERMTYHAGDEEEPPRANAAGLGLNPEAFLGCCGPDASTIDRYGCLPFAQAGEPCMDEQRYYGRCADGLECRRVTGTPSYTCQ